MVFIVGEPLKSTQFGHGDGFAQFKMHVTLGLQQSCEDAVEILARFLGVFGILRLIQFQGFQNIAGLPFV